MRTILRVLLLAGVVIGAALLAASLWFHGSMDPILGIAFVLGTFVFGLALLLWSAGMLWQMRYGPASEESTEERFRRRFAVPGNRS
jgi:hypothetical protein